MFETIYLLAALQGILLSAVLFARKANHAANRILSFATLALSIELAAQVYYAKGWYREFPHGMGLSYPFPYLYGPLFFLYARLLAKKEGHLQRVELLHFVPILVVYALVAPVFLYSGEEKIAFVENMILNLHPPLFSYIEACIPLQGILYTVLTIRTVAEYNRRLKESFSSIELINLNWLKYLTLGMIVIWSIVAIMTVVRALVLPPVHLDAFLHLPISVLIYSIGYMGLKQPEIFLQPSTDRTDIDGDRKYQRSGLSGQQAERIKQQLVELMNSRKPYLQQELTLQKLAELLEVTGHNLSEVINATLHQSYYDFINQYRVEEFKSRVQNPANQYYNILSLAFDSGFSSKGTFNAIFKRSTGMTPSQYKSTLIQQKRMS